MTDCERLKKVIDKYEMSPNAFGKYIGLKNSQPIYDILKGRNGISKEMADRISARCLDINGGWLLTGKGTMFTDLGREEHLLPNSRNTKKEKREGFIERLLILQNKQGFSDSNDFAEFLKFGTKEFSDILNGYTDPTPALLFDICRRTGASINWLENGTDDIAPRQLELDFSKVADACQKAANAAEESAKTTRILAEDNSRVLNQIVASIARLEDKIDKKGDAEDVKDVAKRAEQG